MRIRLLSTNGVNSPGLVRWAIAGYLSGRRSLMVNLLASTYGLSEPSALGLASGKTSYEVVDGHVEFEDRHAKSTGKTGSNAEKGARKTRDHGRGVSRIKGSNTPASLA